MGYHIELTEDPTNYKDQIIRMWQEYLPETPPERYEWMNNTGNPAGKVWWFLAMDDMSKNLYGFITLMPRLFIWKGKNILGGIMGDFVVDKRHRGFGPGLQLPRSVLKKAGELGFRLIYTIPYYGTIKHVERAGFNQKVHLLWFIKPLYFHQYLRNPVAKNISNCAVFLFDKISQSLLLNPIVIRDIDFVEEKSIGHNFDIFFDELKHRRNNILGSRDFRYLTWRYLQNPLLKFQVLTLRKRASRDLLGYVIFTINKCKLDVYDFQYLQGKVKHLLVQKLAWIARRERCEGVYILTSAKNASLSTLRLFGFISIKEEHSLCYAALDPELNLDTWEFLQGDRNV